MAEKCEGNVNMLWRMSESGFAGFRDAQDSETPEHV
jgi:hypothetical protein